MDRRKFFRQGLSQLLRPIASAIAPLERAARKIGELEEAMAHRVPPAHSHDGGEGGGFGAGYGAGSGLWLRPPGAVAEKDFLRTCTRGGECVRACPAHCISIDATGKKGSGAPFIDVDAAACVVCNGLYCMDVCPSGALVPTGINDIDMGTAVWYEASCTRHTGSDCQVCVDECPLGETAITVKGREIIVNPLGCIGCGMCQQHCPTSPKSIVVIPKAAKES
jgi:ferredoxin-type protein NapG